MTNKEKLIDLILNMPAEKEERVFRAMAEAIKMMHQGKSDEEIFQHLGLARCPTNPPRF